MLVGVHILGEALCYALPSGEINMIFHADDCFHGVEYGDYERGWSSSIGNGAIRLVVEEVNLDTKYSAGKLS